MAKKSKLLRKGYSILSIVLALSVVLCMFAMPMSVSAAEGKAPTLIVAEDTFDTLSGWEYTDGVASATDGKLALKTGVGELYSGYSTNLITRPETALNQSVTVEISADDIAAGKYPAIWLRVQGDDTGYVLIGIPNGTFVEFNLYRKTSSSTYTYATQHRKIAPSFFTGTAAGDTMVLTFSAVGNDPTVITMSSDFVNNSWKVETSYEDSTAAFQTAGKVGLSAKSSSADNTMAFDNFVYKSDKIDAVVTDDFTSPTVVELSSKWLKYPSEEYFAINNEMLEMTLPVSSASTRRLQRPMSEAALNQTVEITVSATELAALKKPVLWLRVQNDVADEKPIGYYCFFDGNYMGIGYSVLDKETGKITLGTLGRQWFKPDLTLYNALTYKFSAKSDTEGTTVLNLDIFCDLITGKDWTTSYTYTDTENADLQNAGTVAISGYEQSSENDLKILLDDFKYTTDDFVVSDGFGVELGNNWITYPDDSYSDYSDDKLGLIVDSNIINKNRVQRPMSESAVDQKVSIKVSASELSQGKMPVLWLRVQNDNKDELPVGYYFFYNSNALYIHKYDSNGVDTKLGGSQFAPAYDKYNGFVFNFSAISNGDGSTTLKISVDCDLISGNDWVTEYTCTDDTAELQKAGTVAISGYEQSSSLTNPLMLYDDFRYEYPKITEDTESVIDVRSLVRLKNYIAGYQGSIGAFADYNADGRINSEDLVTVVKHLLGTKLIGGDLVTTELLTGAASAASAALKAEITNLNDTINATGKTYYVSNDGNDNNWGTLKSFPIKTVEKVNELSLEEGDVVLFKRGDVFRTSEMIDVVSGVGYGAYGEGDKPVIMGSLKNYADESIWTSDENRDLWQVSVDAETVGNIVFNEGKAFGQFKNAVSDVKNNGDYYFDAANKTLYLFYIDKNPGKVFDSIEIATTETIFRLPSVRENVTIENIAIKNTAKFGISALHRVSNIVIRGCEIGFIGGGKREEDGAHLGNGIEFWNNASNCLVENNYLYEIYDAALTFQGAGTYGGFTDITYNKNLVENSSMNFEFWLSPKTDDREYFAEPVIKNINFTNNIMRFGGNGFGSKVRPTKESFAFLLARDNEIDSTKFENFNVTGNTFDCTRDSFVYATKLMSMMNIDANTYYQAPISSSQVVRGTGLYANNANELFAAVTTVDKNPIEVAWVNADGTIETPTIISTTEDSADDPWN